MFNTLTNQILFALLLLLGLAIPNHLAIGQIEQSQKSRTTIEGSLPENRLFGGLRWATLVKNIEESRESRRIWFNRDKLTPQGDSMVAIIRDLRYYGLIPKNYHFFEIEGLVGDSNELEKIFRKDVLLTDAFFSIAHDLGNGRSNVKMDSDGDSLLLSLLDQTTKSKNVRANLEKLEPDYAKYRALKEGLKLLLDTLPEDIRLQVMAGISTDSTELQKKIQGFEINMERWRAEKQTFTKKYVMINIPAFMLELFKDDTVFFKSKVIVGTARTPTPVLSSLIECLITYPYWYVPRSIASTELLPKIQKDPAYLTRNNYEVLDRKGNILSPKSIDWKNYSRQNFPFLIRQQEGSHNALGIIKFVFDNPYSIYLHDTNAKNLFNNDKRALSHGCVRVEKAEELAHLLVTDTLNTISPLVEDNLQEKRRNIIELPKTVPIHIRYFTAEYKDGQLYQYIDVYQKDEKIFDVLYK